uniref:Trehalase n=1 Tax=Romanomermis culicivorax TaxID=13658 RepID=A0A915KE15_ROMCU
MTLFNDIGRVILLFLGFFDTPDLDNRAKLIKICMSTTVLGESIQKEEVAGAQAFRQIYCEGPILKAIQEAGLFKDSKHFVDMAMKLDPVTTLRRFYEASNSVHLNKDWLKKFVEENFLPPGDELENCFPDDFKKTLRKFEKIADPHYRTWAQHLHSMWPDLCRQ